MSSLAPIAVFAFKRPEHTRRTLAALALNPELRDSPLYIYCDAARRPAEAEAVEQTRVAVRRFEHPHKIVDEAAANRGLANSIIPAVTSLCERHGRVIVVEDDLVVTPGFLRYMNQSLAQYADEPKVMQVSGHMFPVDPGVARDSFLLPFVGSWGWATWSRAWKLFDPTAAGADAVGRTLHSRLRFDLDGSYPYFRLLREQLAGTVDSWAIRWYLSVYLHAGLALYPRVSLVENIGFDGSGTHCRPEEAHAAGNAAVSDLDVRVDRIEVDAEAYVRVKRYLRRQRGIVGSLRDWRTRIAPPVGGSRRGH